MGATIQKILTGFIPALVPVVGLCTMPSLPSAASEAALVFSELDLYYEAQDIHRTLDFEDDTGVTLNLAGHDRQDGILNLYIRASEGDENAIADQLNAIEPSVGLQFEMDF